jgi:mono/diheme cytochrome c family protein
MRVFQGMRALFVCAVALGGCDGEEEDRQATILGLQGNATAGETVFAAHCGAADCHGPDGQGGAMAPAPAPMPLNVLVPARKDEAIVRGMLDGLGNMEPLDETLTNQEMADALAYVKQQFGPSQG